MFTFSVLIALCVNMLYNFTKWYVKLIFFDNVSCMSFLFCNYLVRFSVLLSVLKSSIVNFVILCMI